MQFVTNSAANMQEKLPNSLLGYKYSLNILQFSCC